MNLLNDNSNSLCFAVPLQCVGSQIEVNGNISFIGNNAENFEGGAVYISEFGQIKLYRGTYISFIDNVGRYVFGCPNPVYVCADPIGIKSHHCFRIGSSIVVDVQRSSQVFSQLIFNTQCFLIFENSTIAPDQWDEVSMCD